MMICSLQRLTVIAVLAAAVWASPARAGSYAFTNFDGPGDITGGTTVNGISNTGVVVGFTQDAGGNFNSFIRNPDGTFAPSSFVQNDQANGVNTDVTVVGGTGTSAFSYSAGVTTPIPSVNGTTTSEVAFG